MNVSSWILAAALLFWGVQVGVWPLALAMSSALVATGLVKRRLAFTLPEFNRALDLCWVLTLGGLLLTYNREPMGSVLRSFSEWAPLVTYPAVLAQAWSAAGRTPVGALLPLPGWRRRHARSAADFDVTAPFLVACVLSASLAGGGRPWFYVGVSVLALWALWAARRPGPWRVGPAFLLLAVVVSGWWVGRGLGELQGWVENRVLIWAMKWRRDEHGLAPARTAIGKNGRVEGSSRVVLEVRESPTGSLPPRLRIGTYSAWREGSWYATASGFQKLEGTADEWILDDRPGILGSAHFELRRDATDSLLVLPGETRHLGELLAESVSLSPQGTVRAEMNVGVVSYRADHAADVNWEGPPSDEDRKGIPSAERAAVDAVAADLGLAGLDPGEAMRRLKAYFQESFRYTTTLADASVADPRATTPIGRFLLGSRAGHCEYFASAAVLLLRVAGVPARYATGFMVSPAEGVQGVHRIRESDGHAWVRFWGNGRWQDFDPTPSAVVESLNRRGRLQRLVADASFAISRWWWLGEKRLLRQAYWLTVPLVLLLGWRFRRLRAARKDAGDASPPAPLEAWPGLDSEWFALAAALATAGWARHRGEDRHAWSERVAVSGVSPAAGGRLALAMDLHERLRFDPRGLGPDERVALRQTASQLKEDLFPSVPAASGVASRRPG